ncbi:unnamed protein product [Blepharisma stoltei]|uniref:TOG domain-containing protein n=1 Tax=Blepharisma stoltei TaxID=1481888 RepID=A0AAU9JZK7_9CILI|nr:unnamed protein product [Blepharisma stoltei]
MQSNSVHIDNLGDTKSEWTLRLRSLQYLQESLTNGESSYADFIEEYKSFIPHLIIQLKDIRSAIVKESIKVLEIASYRFKSTFEPAAFQFVDVLFQMINSSTNLISKSGYEGLKHIIENVYSWKIVLKIAENCKNKSQAIRQVGAECLEFILREYPKYLLDQGEQSTHNLIETVVSAVKGILQDSAPRIRDTGKNAYCALLEKYPEKASQLLNSLPTPLRKAIEEVQARKNPNFLVDKSMDFPVDPKILAEDISEYENMDIYTAVRMAITGGIIKQNNEVNIDLLIKKTHQNNWSARESAFQNLAEVLTKTKKEEDVDKAIPTVLSHLQDKHIKVVYGSLDCLSVIIQHTRNKLTANLPQIMKDVLEWSVHKKESVSSKANSILAQLLETFTADELLNHLLGVSLSRPNVKLAMIEIMSYLIETSETFCFNQYSMSNFVKKLSQLTQDSSTPLIQAIIKTLEAACDKNVFWTLQGILELPFDEQQVFKKLCQEHSPMLEEMLRGYSKNRYVPTIDVIEEVEEEEMSGSVREIDFNEVLQECRAKGPREYIGYLQYLIGKGELPYDSVKEVVEVLINSLDEQYEEEFKKTLRGLGLIAKTYNIDRVGGKIIIGLREVFTWQKHSLIEDANGVLKIIIEKMSTCNAVKALLESIDGAESVVLEKYLDFLKDIVKERTDIKFFGKEIAVKLRDLFGNTSPEVRKNAVLTLAELREMMGKDFDNLYELFSLSQKKLIEIYHQKISSEEP